MKVLQVIQSELKSSQKAAYLYYYLGLPESFPVDRLDDLLRNHVFSKRFPGFGGGSSVPTFDDLRDFDVVYACFRRYHNIDLLKEDIGWFEYQALLEDLLLSENSITKRIEIRSYTPPRKITDSKTHVAQMNLRNRYALESINVQSQLEQVFLSMKSKAR